MRISVTGEPDPTYCKASADSSGTSYNLNATPLFTNAAVLWRIREGLFSHLCFSEYTQIIALLFRFVKWI